jgi:GAF domain-containing protein
LSVRSTLATGDEIGTLARTFNTMTERLAGMVTTLEQRVTERTGQLQAAADIGRATTSVRDLDELMTLALALIRDRFGFYHASIFLLDRDERFAVLRESTGPVGAQLKARGHKLGVGSKSLIGWVTRHRQPRIALDVGEDPFHFKNPLLPDTRSELAIPLSVGDRLLGALDVQSTEPNAFGPGDVQVIQTVADQLSIAIENALLFERTQANLHELSDLYQRIANVSWRGLLRGQATEKTYEAAGAPAPADAAGPPMLVPLVVGDQTVGFIELYGRDPEAWAPEERTVLNSIAAQVASALESASLLEEAQRRRVQEQVINDVTQQMRASLNPASVVQSGARELGKALGATEVIVRLRPAGAPARANGGEG